MTRYRFQISSSKQSQPETIEVRGESEAMAWERVLRQRPDALPLEPTIRVQSLSATRS